MKQRCYNKNEPNYKNYGGRGITVCDRWLESFDNFLEDMGKRPSPKHSIDRIDNDKGYSPDNCRWATKETQARNTRRTKLTVEKVKIIRECYSYDKKAFSAKWLANAYGVGVGCIESVVTYKTWRDL